MTELGPCVKSFEALEEKEKENSNIGYKKMITD